MQDSDSVPLDHSPHDLSEAPTASAIQLLAESRPRAYAELSQSVRSNERKIIFKRTSFQNGSLKKEARKLSHDVWTYRWREIGTDGKVRKPKLIIGTVEEYPRLSLAKRAVEALGLDVNAPKSNTVLPQTMERLMTHYAAKELSEERVNKTPYTCDVYRGYFKTWILPRWGTYKLTEIKTAEVESWLRSIDRADGTKVKIRNLMATLFNHAIRWEFIKSNPITGPSRGAGVRQSGKRQKDPEVLSITEIRSILKQLPVRLRTMVFLIAATGLRFSELRGLKWTDVNFTTLSLNIRRGVLKGYLGDLKSRASHRVMSLHPELARALANLQAGSIYSRPNDWVFASTRKNGTIPIWPNRLMEDHVRPAAKRAGIEKQVSWKMFRTTLATQMNDNGENVKTSQHTLGHANSQLTADVYTQPVPATVRTAHDRIVDMILLDEDEAIPEFREGRVGPMVAPERSGVAVSC